MDMLLRKVEKELDQIAEKGISSGNLEATYKLIDIYKDIKEACYYEKMSKDSEQYDNYGARGRDSRGRYTTWHDGGEYDERTGRYMARMNDGMRYYNEGRDRYRDGKSDEKMEEGIEMTMGAIVNLVEFLVDHAETSKQKETVRKYVDKLKNV